MFSLVAVPTLAVVMARTSISWTWYCLIGSLVTVVIGYAASLFMPAPTGVERYTFSGLPPSDEGGVKRTA